MDYSLGTAEDLKTKQDIHTSLSSFHFRDYWDLKDLHRSATHQIHGSYPRFYQTSSRDRELATSPGAPFYFQSLWLYKNSLYELNSVSWELPECPILYIFQCQITLPVIALKLYLAHIKVSLYWGNSSQVSKLGMMEELWKNLNQIQFPVVRLSLPCALGYVRPSGLKFLTCQMGSQYPPHRK